MLRVKWSYTEEAKKALAIEIGEVPKAENLDIGYPELSQETREQLYSVGFYSYSPCWGREDIVILRNLGDVDEKKYVKQFDTERFTCSVPVCLYLGQLAAEPTKAEVEAEIARIAKARVYESWSVKHREQEIAQANKRSFNYWLDKFGEFEIDREEYKLLSDERRAEVERESARRKAEMRKEAEAQPATRWLEKDGSPDQFTRQHNHSGDLWRLLSDEQRAEIDAEGQRIAERRKQAAKQAARDRTAAKRELLIAAGADEPLQRFEAGYLPKAELRDIARDYLFRSIDLPKYSRLRESHCGPCGDSDCEDRSVEFDSSPLGELTAEQYVTLQKLRMQVPAGATIELQIHSVSCANCAHELDGRAERCSARVEITWAGQKLSRLYAL